MSRYEGAQSPPRRILLVDADAFFVAVARLVDPEGAGREPLLLVGGRPEERGVVCSASYEARQYGVRSAMSTAQALRLCPQALVVPVPRQACVERSGAILQTLRRFAPTVAAARIDEWYLDLVGTERLYGEPLLETARKIRAAVADETGLPVSIGGGTNKLIAKLAVELGKRPPPGAERGAHIVEPGDEAAFMTRFQLGDLPMVGPRLQERLAALGLRSVADALPYEEAALGGLLGERLGHWLYGRLRGHCDDPVDSDGEIKSVGREETFPADLRDRSELGRALLGLLSEAASELRRSGYRARTLTIKVKDSDFTQRQKSRTLASGVESERALWPLAQALLDELRAARPVAVRLLGVSLSGLGLATDEAAPAATQLALFQAAAPVAAKKARTAVDLAADTVETARDRALSRLRDAVRGRFGDDALKPALCVPQDSAADR
jgi:DNA polymerase-4